MIAIKFSMEKRIKIFWNAGFFLPAINATVFMIFQKTQKFAFDPIYHSQNLHNNFIIILQWGKILSEIAFLFSKDFFKK